MKQIIHKASGPLILLLLTGFLVACSGADVPRIPMQQWQDLNIVVETRPVIVKPGMNEVLIIATLTTGLPGHDMVVSLRMDEQARWQQAIQDGHSGVYRKAIRIEPGQQHVQVNLKRKNNEQTVLRFQLLTRD